MPELPEVETVRRGLASVLEGRRIVRVSARRPDLRFPLPRGFVKRVEGRRVEEVDRRAKFLLVRLEGGLVLIGHLGMSGRIAVYEGAPPRLAAHDHIVFLTDTAVTIRYNDARRFGFFDLCAADELSRHPMLSALGPEPLGDHFDGAWLSTCLTGRSAPVKTAILDQRVVAGMGNIYASESLFRARLSPRRMAHTVSGWRAARLAEAIKAVFNDAISAGGSSLRDHRQTSGELGYFQHRFAVYGRAGEPCPGCDCDVAATGGVRTLVQSGRSTFYCAKQQR